MSVAAAEFDVDQHGVVTEHAEDESAEPELTQDAAETTLVAMGWTPEEATALVCAIWNLGILIYGPEWAADPRETLGWNISVAQLLDVYVPKGTGGMVQLGAGLLMIGNGLVMMAARRTPIIRRGPRPIWVRQPQAEGEATPTQTQPTPQPAPAASSPFRDNGHYEMPRDLRPAPSPDLEIG